MHTVIIGGGLGGLTAAFILAGAGTRVTVLEGAERWGGQIRTQHTDGFTIEHGAEGFTAASGAVPVLCRELEMAERIVNQRARSSFMLVDGELGSLEPGEAARRIGLRAADSGFGRGIMSFAAGMGELVDVLVAWLKRDEHEVDLRLGARATAFEQRGTGWQVRTEADSFIADAAVVALPARDAADLLGRSEPDCARALRALHVRSSVTVSLAYRRSHVSHSLDASGFIVPHAGPAPGVSGSAPELRACAFSSSKLPNRAPDEWCLLRAFFRPNARDIATRSDRWWAVRAHDLIAPVIGISGGPPSDERSWVARWPNALTEWRPGAIDGSTCREIASLVAGNLVLAGAGVHCCGLDGAVASGRNAARQLLAPCAP
ncbi:MAG: protoporphyrinogen/coproporphyrinogen oxidase [Gemmatimonadaceae bacterium]